MSEKFIQICFIHLCGAPEENYTHSGLHRLLDEIPGVKYLGGDHSAVLPCKHFKDENTQSPPVNGSSMTFTLNHFWSQILRSTT